MNKTLLDAVRQSLVGKFDPEWIEEALIAADAVPEHDDTTVFMQTVCTAMVTVLNSRIDALTARTEALNRQTDLLEAQQAIKRVEAIDAGGPVRH